jgi:hypothetical protein
MRVGEVGLCPRGKCLEVKDELGCHAISCLGGGCITRRHNALCRVIHAECQTAALQPILELEGLDRGSQRRPGDVVVRGFRGKAHYALDVACISPTQVKYVEQAQYTMLQAANVYDSVVKGKVSEWCQSEGIFYTSLVAENTGGWTKKAMAVFREITSQAAERTGADKHMQLKRLLQRLSCSM